MAAFSATPRNQVAPVETYVHSTPFRPLQTATREGLCAGEQPRPSRTGRGGESAEGRVEARRGATVSSGIVDWSLPIAVLRFNLRDFRAQAW